jgi:hypothetical protein
LDKIKINIIQNFIKGTSTEDLARQGTSTELVTNILELNECVLLKLFKEQRESPHSKIYITSYTDKGQSKLNTKFKIDLLDKNTFKTTSQFTFDLLVCFRFNLFLKSKDTLLNFLKIVNSSTQFSIGFINTSNLPIGGQDRDIKIENSEINYYFENLTNQKIFNTCKIFLNNLTNENQLIEYTIDYDYLIDFFSFNGYKCTFTTHEQFYTFCTFEKEFNNVIPNISYSSIIPYKKIHNTPFQQKLSFYKIQNNSDIIDLVNCFGFSIYPGQNDSHYSPYEFCNIHNIPFQNKFDYDCLFFHKVLEDTEAPEGGDLIETKEEILYIVLYDNKIFSNPFHIYKLLYKIDIHKIKNEIQNIKSNHNKIKLSLINNFFNILQLTIHDILPIKSKVNLLNKILF